jgi:hypothetical protein
VPNIPPHLIRDFVSDLRSKYPHPGEWYQGIPPVKARYMPRFSTQNIVLVEGVIHYQIAEMLMLNAIRCTFVK